MPDPLRVMVLGATGVFGSRLCERLVRISNLYITATSRQRARAEHLAQRLTTIAPQSRVEGRAVTIEDGFAKQLRGIAPDVVVHTAGPFQGQDYQVAEICIANRIHYIDLSDGSDFVAGFCKLDPLARKAGCMAVTGASSVPGLSSVVVDALAKQFRSIDSIDIGINSGSGASLGPALAAAILGYCGRPIPAWRDGRRGQAFGWQGLVRRRIPGLGSRWFCDCDVPDVLLFPARYPGVRAVRFRAGVEVRVIHFGLWGLAWLRRMRLLPSLGRIVPLACRLAAGSRGLGTNRGGMYVEVSGNSQIGDRITKAWTLVAEGDHGPFVPTLPATILVRKLAAGTLDVIGAMPCLGLFTLRDFMDEVSDLAITVSGS